MQYCLPANGTEPISRQHDCDLSFIYCVLPTVRWDICAFLGTYRSRKSHKNHQKSDKSHQKIVKRKWSHFGLAGKTRSYVLPLCMFGDADTWRSCIRMTQMCSNSFDHSIFWSQFFWKNGCPNCTTVKRIWPNFGLAGKQCSHLLLLCMFGDRRIFGKMMRLNYAMVKRKWYHFSVSANKCSHCLLLCMFGDNHCFGKYGVQNVPWSNESEHIWTQGAKDVHFCLTVAYFGTHVCDHVRKKCVHFR